MDKKFNSKLISFLLALVMIFGTISPAIAAGLESPIEPEQQVESELIAKDGKLRAKLVVPKKQQVQTKRAGLFRAPAKAPTFDETIVKVNIEKHGIGSNEFNFDAIFGPGATKKITLYNDADDSEQEVTFNSTDTSVKFPNAIPMKNVTDGDVYIEFEGGNVAGKLTYEESSDSHSGASNETTFKLDLYQVRNTDVIVKTVNGDGTEVTNPSTADTNGKIKLGSMSIEKDIPADDTPLTFVDNISVRDVAKINGDPNYEVTGLEKGVLVDKTANKVYKPTIGTPDSNGINPTEITFIEKPLVTEDSKYANDKDYVAVTFAQGDHGTIATNKTYYVFKGVTMASTLEAPTVTANTGWTHNGWKPNLATKYDSATEHVAQYEYSGDDIVPQNPGEDKPDVPDNFVKVDFSAGEHGTIAADQTVIYWVNPEKEVTVPAPTVTPNKGYTQKTGADAWDHALTATFAKATTITAQYNNPEDVVPQNPGEDKPDVPDNFVKVDFSAGEHGTIAADQTVIYWVNPEKEVTVPAPTVTPNKGYTQKTGADAWDHALTATFAKATTITAQYNNPEDVVPQNPGEDKPDVPDNFVKVDFSAGEHGTIAADQTVIYWVNPEKEVTVPAPTVTPNKGYTQKTGADAWDHALTATFAKATTITAQYNNPEDVVPQNPGEDKPDVPDNFVKVDFSAGEHGTIAADQTVIYWVNPEKEVTVPAPTVTPNKGYTQKTGADAWDHALTATFAKATTITAQYNNPEDVVPQNPGEDKPDVPDNFVKVDFSAGEHGTIAADQTVIYWVNPEKEVTVPAPTVTPNKGYTQKTGADAWDHALTATFAKATTITAQYNNPEDVVPQNPGEDKPDVPDNFVKVDFSAGEHGTIAADQTVIYWVNPEKEVTVPAPTVTPNKGYTQKTGADAWDHALTATFAKATTITAQYNNPEDVVPQNPGEDKPDVPDNFVKVDFSAGEHGTIAADQTVIYWVNPEKEVTVPAPTVTPNKGYTQKTGADAWDHALTATFAKATTITAQYNNPEDVVPQNPGEDKPDVPDNFVKVDFSAGEHGTIAADQTVIYWVNPEKEVTVPAPTVTPNKGYTQKTGADAWDHALTATFAKATTITAQYNNPEDVVPQNPGEDKPDVPDNFVKVDFSAGEHGTIAADQTVIYWVNPEKEVTVPAPTVTPNKGYTQKTGADAWDHALTATFAKATTITAQYNNPEDVVPQNPGEDKPDVPDNFVKVDFSAGEHGTIAADQTVIYWVNPEKEVTVPAPTVTPNKGYTQKTGADAWDHALTATFAKATTITAQYNNPEDVVPQNPGEDKPDVPDNFVKVDFSAGEHGTIAADQTVIYWVNPEKEVTVPAPTVTPNKGYTQKTGADAWDHALTATFAKATTITAQYNNPEDVVPQNPGEDKPDVPDNFVKVDFSAGEHGTIAADQTVIYWVNPEKEVTVPAPTVTPNKGYTQKTGADAWDHALTATFAKATTITAQYNNPEDVVPQNPGEDKPDVPDNFVKVDFSAGEHGTIAADQTVIYWVNPEKEVTVPAPTVTPNKGYTQKTGADAWDHALTATFAKATTITAQYNNPEDVVPQNPGEDKPDVPDNFVKVDFSAGEHGTIAADQTVIYWVNPEKEVTVPAPTVTPNKGYTQKTGADAWDHALTATFAKATTITAQYNNPEDVVPQNPGEDKPDVPDNFVKVDFSAGEHGTIAADQTVIYWVNPEKEVTVPAPTVTPNKGYTQKTGADAWDHALTATFAKATTITAQYNKTTPGTACLTEAGLKAQFEDAINSMFDGISSKPGIYEGSYDASKKEVTVKIIDASQKAAQLSGTGLASGLDKLYKNNHLIKIQVGTQEERDLDVLASAQPSSGLTLQQLFATIFGTDVLNEVQKTGEKSGTLLDFIDKSVVLKLTIQQKDCEGEKPSVTLEYTVKGIDGNPSKVPTIDKVTEGDKKITGKGEKDAKIVVKDEDGRTIGETTVKPDGTWEVEVPDGREPKKDDKITATQTEEGKNPSKPAETTVVGKDTPVIPTPEKSEKPIINPIYDSDDYVTGEGVPGATVEVRFPDGTIERVIVDRDGRWVAPIPYPLYDEEIVEARQIEFGKEPSDWVYEKVRYDDEYWRERDRRDRDDKKEDTKKPSKVEPRWTPPALNARDHFSYIKGYGNNIFGPNRTITRAEVAMIFARISVNQSTGGAPQFKDVKAGDWYKTAVDIMAKQGIVKGYEDGTFRPNQPITRREFAAIAARYAGNLDTWKTFRDVPPTDWAYKLINRVAGAGWINGYEDGTFRPNNNITRAEVVAIVNRMLNRKADAKYVDNNLMRTKGAFVDNMRSAWYYYDIYEAAFGHSFERQPNGVDEKWNRVTGQAFEIRER